MAIAIRELEQGIELQANIEDSRKQVEAALVEDWLKRNDSPHTRRSYQCAFDEFMEFIGHKALIDITSHDIRLFKEDLIEHMQAGSANQRIATVKSLFTYCHRTGYLKCNPGSVVRLYKIPDKLAERILDRSDIIRIIELESNKRNHAMLSMLYCTGARVSELVALNWKDIQAREDAGQVTLWGKGGKTRAVKIPVRLWNELQILKGNAENDAPVFKSQKHGHLDVTQVRRIIQTAARRAGINSNVSPHWFRHAHASHSLDASCPIHVLKETLGHTSLATTSRYCHARPSESSSDYLNW